MLIHTYCYSECVSAKIVLYITDVGYFRLTPAGVQLECVMPGVDIKKDIVDAAPEMKIVFPNGDINNVSIAPESVITGRGFKLGLGTGIVLPSKL